MVITGPSVSELGLQLSLLYLEMKKTSPMLVFEAIGLGCVSLNVALMLLEIAASAIFLSSAIGLRSL